MPRAYRRISYGRNNCSSPCHGSCVKPAPPCPPKPPCLEDLAAKCGFYPWKNIFGCLSKEELLQLLSFAEGFRLWGDFFASDLSVILAAAHFKKLWEFQEMLDTSYIGATASDNQLNHPLGKGTAKDENFGWTTTAFGMQYLDLQKQPRNFAIAVAGGSY